MERTSEASVNGQAGEPHMGPDPKTAFYLIDPTTKQKHLIRDMDDAQLAAFHAGVSHVSREKVKVVLTRLQLLLQPIDVSLCMGMLDDAFTTVSLQMVLEYEQNRRKNLPAPEGT